MFGLSEPRLTTDILGGVIYLSTNLRDCWGNLRRGSKERYKVIALVSLYEYYIELHATLQGSPSHSNNPTVWHRTPVHFNRARTRTEPQICRVQIGRK